MERKYRVLIVDDEEEIRTTYSAFLAKRGFEVEVAGDGAEGLRMLRERQFDAALVDLIMPQKGGLEMIREAREEGIDTDYIILTAHGEKEHAVNAIKTRVKDWFEKDRIDMEDLYKSVQNATAVIPLDEVRSILSALPAASEAIGRR